MKQELLGGYDDPQLIVQHALVDAVFSLYAANREAGLSEQEALEHSLMECGQIIFKYVGALDRPKVKRMMRTICLSLRESGGVNREPHKN